MAYIRKRGKYWSYTIDVGKDPVSGERRQETKSGFRTKRETELAAAEIETEVAKGTYVRESKISFREFTEKWLRWYKAGILSKKPKVSSMRQREYQVRTLMLYFDAIMISQITRSQYQDALLDLLDKLSHETVKGIHATGRMIFRKAVQDGIIKTNPTDYTKVPSNDEIEESPKYMEKETLAEFLHLAKTRGIGDDYVIFLTLAYTGMRIGELCVLQWDDVNFEDQTISIKGTLFNPDDIADAYEILTPKTKTSKRTVDVDDNLISELKYLKVEQSKFIALHEKKYHNKGFVFGRTDSPRNSKKTLFGYPPVRRTIENRMDRLMQWMATTTRFTPHSLRHTHTSLCAEAGVSLEAIMQRLGHKDDRTTRAVYLHATRSVKREAAIKFSALMNKVVKM